MLHMRQKKSNKKVKHLQKMKNIHLDLNKVRVSGFLSTENSILECCKSYISFGSGKFLCSDI